jgi:hypothetical protein
VPARATSIDAARLTTSNIRNLGIANLFFESVSATAERSGPSISIRPDSGQEPFSGQAFPRPEGSRESPLFQFRAGDENTQAQPVYADTANE